MISIPLFVSARVIKCETLIYDRYDLLRPLRSDITVRSFENQPRINKKVGNPWFAICASSEQRSSRFHGETANLEAMKRIAVPILALALFTCPMADAGSDFSGLWRQDASRSVPEGKQGRLREMQIQQHNAALTVKVTTKRSSGPRSLDLKYEIGGNELIYTGLDGDEFHTRVRWRGESLVFDTVEHQRGKQFVSKQIWTLTDGGKCCGK